MSKRSVLRRLWKMRAAVLAAIIVSSMNIGCEQSPDLTSTSPGSTPEKSAKQSVGEVPPAADFAGRAAALEDTLARFMAPGASAAEPSRSHLADELVLLMRLALDNQRLQADVEKELQSPETGYFLARLDALREETESKYAAGDLPADHWSRVFDGVPIEFDGEDRFELDPFRGASYRPLRSDLGEVPTAMNGVGGSEKRIALMNYALLVLRKHDPAAALRMQRNLFPEVGKILFVERMNTLGYAVYPVLAREIPPAEKVPKVDDQASACAEYLKRFIYEIIPAERAKAAIEQEMEVRGAAFEELHRRVVGKTMEQILREREDSTDADPILVWRDLVREFHPDRLADVAAMIQFMTSPVIERNQSSARGLLADIYSAQKQFRDADRDGNGTADYWVADVSGLRRLLVDGKPIELIDESSARLDARPLADAPSLAKLTDEITSAKKPGYLLVAVKFDAEGRPLSEKTDDSSRAGRNARKFAVCAYPRTYGRTGRQTYVIMEDGRIRFKDTDGAPLERLPKDFTDDDWTTDEEPVEAAISFDEPKLKIGDLDLPGMFRDYESRNRLVHLCASAASASFDDGRSVSAGNPR